MDARWQQRGSLVDGNNNSTVVCRAGPCQWTATLISLRCLWHAPRRGGVHRRSVPPSVALVENDYASVPPVAPSIGTDRSCTLVAAHIRSIIGGKCATRCQRNGRRAFAPRLYGFACAVKVRLAPAALRGPPLTALAFANGRRLRVTLALASPVLHRTQMCVAATHVKASIGVECTLGRLNERQALC